MCQLHGEGFDRQWLEENDEYDSPNNPGLSVTRIFGSGDRVRSAFSKIIRTIHVVANVYDCKPY